MDEIIAVMTQTEAHDWKRKVSTQANSLRVLIAEGYERQAWRALGYKDWTECIGAIADEFGLSERHMWRLHSANETQKNLLTHGSVDSELVSERQLRPLTRLEPAEQVRVWEQVVATAPEGKITAAHVQAVVDEVKDNKPHVSFNSGNNEWYTPTEYIEAARRVMGGIDLDPASSDIANKTVRADVYLTAEDDGLRYSWSGRVWMNPPYSGELIGKFSAKLAEHYKAGDISEAIVLVNNATETAWYQGMVKEAAAVCFLKGRIKYNNSQGVPENSPLQGQTFLYFGERPLAFASQFSHFGVVLYARR